MMDHITFGDFLKQFSSENACLEHLKKIRYPDGIFCEKCWTITKHYKLKDRRAYSCRFCRHQVYVTAGTIFARSAIPLQFWFIAVFMFIHSRNGVVAKEIQRQLGISYGAAWRMCRQIRTAMAEPTDRLLNGVVETDETFIGGKGYNRRRIWWANWEERPKQIML